MARQKQNVKAVNRSAKITSRALKAYMTEPTKETGEPKAVNDAKFLCHLRDIEDSAEIAREVESFLADVNLILTKNEQDIRKREIGKVESLAEKMGKREVLDTLLDM